MVIWSGISSLPLLIDVLPATVVYVSTCRLEDICKRWTQASFTIGIARVGYFQVGEAMTFTF